MLENYMFFIYINFINTVPQVVPIKPRENQNKITKIYYSQSNMANTV